MPSVEIGSAQVAVLYDALRKADQIAPTKGAAWDRAQGVHLTFKYPDRIEVRSTDTEVTYWQSVEAIIAPASADDPEPDCHEVRLPSNALTKFVATLPMNSEEHRVRFLIDPEAPKTVIVQFGKKPTKAKMQQIVSSYPRFGPVEADDLGEAQEVASRVEQVAWACNDHGPMAGVYMDGEWMIGTDTKKAVRCKCKIETDGPIVAPMDKLVPLLKMGTEVRMGVKDNRLVVMLDDSTQITSTIIVEPYPQVMAALSRFELPDEFTVNRQRMIDAMKRLLLFARDDRIPYATLWVRDGKMDMMLRTDGTESEDALALASQTFTAERSFKFNPNLIQRAFETFTSTNLVVSYSAGAKPYPWHVRDPGAEYEAWLMPMTDNVGDEG